MLSSATACLTTYEDTDKPGPHRFLPCRPSPPSLGDYRLCIAFAYASTTICYTSWLLEGIQGKIGNTGLRLYSFGVAAAFVLGLALNFVDFIPGFANFVGSFSASPCLFSAFRIALSSVGGKLIKMQASGNGTRGSRLCGEN